MSRIRKATIAASFGYAQFALSIATGILLVPLTLRYLGARNWGLWLASGEVLGYAAMIDLGVLGVLPWMIAEADGRRDRTAIRRLVAHGLVVSFVVAAGYAAAAWALWTVLPTALRLSAADRATIAPPLTLLIALNALGYPLRVFRALLTGLQDALFNGAITLLQSALTVLVTVVLLMQGRGLYALALAATVPALVVLVIAALRVVWLAPDLLRGWTLPTFSEMRLLLTNGMGVWLGGMGWQLLAASNAVVITFLGYPEWVAVYSVTAKLSALGSQLAWVLPDSGLVALAQVSGEHRSDARVRDVVLMMLRLHLLLAGGAAIMLLAFNPAFVSVWVGPELFGGLRLNALLAAGILLYSFIHGLIATASVLGNRLQVGVVTVANGGVQIALAVVLGRIWGINGIALSGLIAGAVTAVPASLMLLRPRTGLRAGMLARELVRPWAARIAALLVAAGAVGMFYRALGIGWSSLFAALLLAAYVWQMRPLYAELPLPARVSDWLVRLRLLPAAPLRPLTPATVGADEA